jgi:Tol biopolymer transport system component
MGKPIYHTTHEVSDLRLSPRGDRIAFYEHAETAEVVVVDRTGAARVVASGGNPPSRGLAWSPDGQEVWYSMAPNLERNQIWAVAPGGKPRSVLDLPAEVVIEDIAPDGRVLVEQLDYRSSIFVGDGTAADRDLSWYQNSLINDIAPDGSAIVFADGMDLGRPSFSMFLRPVGGGQAVRLGDDLGGFGAHLSPDRRWLLATSEDQQQIFVLPIGAGDVRTLAHPGVDEIRGETSWLADGSGVAYVGAGRGADTAQVFVQKLDGSPPRPVGPAGDYGELGLAPDGRRYAVETVEGVRVRSFDGGEDRLVVPDARLGHFLRWTTGGDFELFYRIGETPGAIYALDLGNGHVERRRTLMPADPVGVWRIHPVAVTPDGTKYAYSVVRWLSELFVYSGLK